MPIDIEGSVAIQFRITLPIKESHRLARLVEDLGALIAESHATIEDSAMDIMPPASPVVTGRPPPKKRQPTRQPTSTACARCGHASNVHHGTCRDCDCEKWVGGHCYKCDAWCFRDGGQCASCYANTPATAASLITGKRCGDCGKEGHRRDHCPEATKPPDPGPQAPILAQPAPAPPTLTEPGPEVTTEPSEATCVHHWKIGNIEDCTLDEEGIGGTCTKCGAQRSDFNPYRPVRVIPPAVMPAAELRVTGENIVAVPRSKGASPKCLKCNNHPRSHAHMRECAGFGG